MSVHLRTWPEEGDKAAFVLPPTEVHVWSAPYPPQLGAFEEFDPFLSRDEWARAERLLTADKRAQFRYSHGLLRLLLGRYLDRPPLEVRLATGPNGKPFLDSAHLPRIEFSLSHTKGLEIFAFAIGGALGIDVEAVLDLPDRNSLARVVLSDRELLTFESLPEERRTVAFLRYWTAKEACLKALGRGLSLDPRRVEVRPSAQRMSFARVVDDGEAGATEWQLLTFGPAPGFIASLSWQRAIADEAPPVLIGFGPRRGTGPGGSCLG